MIWVSKSDFSRAIRGIHYRIIIERDRIMALIDDVKASADAAVADLAALRAKVADISAKLDAAVAAAGPDLTPQLTAIKGELDAAVAIDAPPAAPPA